MALHPATRHPSLLDMQEYKEIDKKYQDLRESLIRLEETKESLVASVAINESKLDDLRKVHTRNEELFKSETEAAQAILEMHGNALKQLYDEMSTLTTTLKEVIADMLLLVPALTLIDRPKQSVPRWYCEEL